MMRLSSRTIANLVCWDIKYSIILIDRFFLKAQLLKYYILLKNTSFVVRDIESN